MDFIYGVCVLFEIGSQLMQSTLWNYIYIHIFFFCFLCVWMSILNCLFLAIVFASSEQTHRIPNDTCLLGWRTSLATAIDHERW